MLPEALPRPRELFPETMGRRAELAAGDQPAGPTPQGLAPRADDDAFAVEWQLAATREAGP